MDRFINHENINNYADKLSSEVDPARRAMLTKLLVEEMDRLAHRTQELELADRRLTSGRRLIATQQSLIASLAQNGRGTSRENLCLTRLLHVQALFETYRQKILDALNR